MDPNEIERLVSDIQGYLNEAARKKEKPDEETAHDIAKAPESDEEHAGSFITAKSLSGLKRCMRLSTYASYAVEMFTIALFTGGVLVPFSSWPRTIMFLLGVLIFGIFAITVLLSLQARIHLLLRIESNTRQIAVSKSRIAEALEKIHID